VVLNVFELLTATFAAEQFRLGEDWAIRQQRLSKFPVLRNVENVDFLQIVSLLATSRRQEAYLQNGGDVNAAPGVGCRRRDILRLTLAEYQEWADKAEAGLVDAAQFMSGQRIFSARDVPYRTQLVPLATINAKLGKQASLLANAEKIARWYWCGVLGELYGGAIETRFARDSVEVPLWINGGAEPATVTDANFAPSRLLTLRTRNSAAYKGIYALLMHDCADWLYDKALDHVEFFNESIDIHHVFPKDWCMKQAVDDTRRESIVNKTALSASTNRAIGGRAPSIYLKTLADEKHANVEAKLIDERVRSHKIDPACLRNDDFDAYFADRSAQLLGVISSAMGKPVLTQAAGVADDVDEFDLEAEELEADGAPVLG
jgi:hypothetical protein